MLSGSTPRAALAAVPGRWAGVCLLLSSVLLLLGLPRPALAQTPCSTTSTAVSGFTGTLTDLATDCTTLLGLKDTLRGTGSLNWAESTAMSTWEGVTVAGTPPRVRRLNVSNKNLTGTIPTALSDLPKLQWLNLYGNSLNGTIPKELGTLSNLTWLDLAANRLSGSIPKELGNLAKLQGLMLHFNGLSGPIPKELGSLANLEWLSLSSNRLSGPIPPELGSLAKLKLFSLQVNDLTGSIPKELGTLAKLQWLSLHLNALTGSIPPELGSLAKLESLSLYATGLTGPIPPELGNLANLRDLDLDTNDLTGPIPPELGNLANLTRLILDTNDLTGPIPPELGNLANLTRLSLHTNALTGSIPPELGTLANLTRLSLHTNALTGPIPPELGNLANLTRLILHTNGLTGPIPPELGNLANLEMLILDTNALTGPIPPELGNLANLKMFFLYDTNWVGEVPPVLVHKAGLGLQAGLDLRANRRPIPNLTSPVFPTGEESTYVAFTDPDGAQTLSCFATQADGSSLPEWLDFDQTTCTFSGAPETAGTVEVEVATVEMTTAAARTDRSPAFNETATFTLILGDGPPPGSDAGDGSDNTGDTGESDNTGNTGNTGSGNTGTGNTGSGNTGSGNTGNRGNTGSGGGEEEDRAAQPVGLLENPGPASFQSGVGVISGWVCEAETVEIAINGETQPAAYGTERADTADICGDTDNGFGLLFNWNRLGDGDHTVVAYVDGEELGRATVTVTTLGAEFVRDVAGTCEVEDFPSPGETGTLVWQQNSQNFVIVDGSTPSGVNRAGTPGVGYLENPGPNSSQSGVGVISGWVCEAETVEMEIGHLGRQVAAYGTERLDTQAACGDTDNGFGLLFNWNRLGDGEHEVVASVDEEELGRATVQVTTLGEEFVRGAEGMCEVTDFPLAGQTVTLEWQQSSQNFVITGVD